MFRSIIAAHRIAENDKRIAKAKKKKNKPARKGFGLKSLWIAFVAVIYVASLGDDLSED